MRPHILDDIPFAPDLSFITEKYGFAPDSADYRELAALCATAPAGRPKACYAEVGVKVDGGNVWLAGFEFASPLVLEHLAGQQAVWPFVATCGLELYGWAHGLADPFNQYIAEEILAQALQAARQALDGDLRRRYGDLKRATLSPGSLKEWPIQGQTPLFGLLAEGTRAIGVRLEESLLMTPNKSVSGIRFLNEHGFESCQRCPRENCPNRRAPFEGAKPGSA